MRATAGWVGIVLLLLCTSSWALWGCERAPEGPVTAPEARGGGDEAPVAGDRGEAPAQPPDATPEGAAPEVEAAPEGEAPPARLVAIGDLHGDLEATRAVFRLVGAIDEADRWIGGPLVVVQTGDQLDRGDGEIQILDLLDRIKLQAGQAGGALVVLNGNHEIMNAQGDMRYVTPAGFAAFDELSNLDLTHPEVQRHPEEHRARVAAFRPGEPFARRLAERDLIAVIGGTAFAHGGILPEHVDYGVDRINAESRRWLKGEQAELPPSLAGEGSPIWMRRYSDEDEEPEPDCAALGQTLDKLGARRMVVGHTVQEGGISASCGGRIWRIDVGLSRHYGGKPQALEIAGDAVQIIE